MQSKTFKNGEYADLVISTADKYFLNIIVYKGFDTTRICMTERDWNFIKVFLGNF